LPTYESLAQVSEAIRVCRRCPRLVRYRESIPRRRSFSSEEYWRRPIAGFGDPQASLVVIGLAPAAHGGNRTGRVFTGDESGRFLVEALYEAGFTNQPTSTSRDDGLVYRDCYITAAVRCAPPDNKPTAIEFRTCSSFLDAELAMLQNARSVLALGGAAFEAYLAHLRRMGVKVAGARFAHGKRYDFPGFPTLYASYHPSPRNTYTKKLTKKMFLSLLKQIRSERLVGSLSSADAQASQ
jgi:uracil-DNA glycosylase family 4